MDINASVRLRRLLFFLTDLLLLNVAFAVAYYVRFDTFRGLLETPYGQLLIIYNLAWQLAAFLLSAYEVPQVWSYRQVLGALLRTILFHGLLVTAYWVARKGYFYSRLHLGYTFTLLVVLLTVWRTVYVWALRTRHRRGVASRTAILIGNTPPVGALQQFFTQHPEHGYRLLRTFDSSRPDALAEAQAYMTQHRVDEIYAALTHLSNEEVQALIAFADQHLIRVKLLPDFRGFEPKNLRIDLYGNLPVVAVRQYPLDDAWNRSVKRAFDFGFALVFMVAVGSWLFPLLALLVRLSSPGPVFFKQRRHGKDGKEFLCYKFRTMYVNADADTKQATRGDSRITPIGAVLRRTNLDELPQFLNVLKGEMSVVGPRPHPLPLNETYSPLIDKYMIRHVVKPGLTGLAQAMGYRGETPTVQYMKNRVKMDRFYVDNWSLALDVQIIFWTVVNMLRGEQNAY